MKFSKWQWRGFVVLGAVVLGGLALWAVPTVAAREGMCAPAPADFERIERQDAVDSEGYDVNILRAIVATGEGWISDSREEIVFPPCWSREEGLTSLRNLKVTLTTDGREVTIITGVGWREERPLGETPQTP